MRKADLKMKSQRASESIYPDEKTHTSFIIFNTVI